MRVPTFGIGVFINKRTMKNVYRIFCLLGCCLFLLTGASRVYAQFPAPYCAVTFPSNSNDVGPITLVNFAGINNSGPNGLLPPNTNQLEDFTSITGYVSPGQTYPIRVKGNTAGAWTYYVTVFIDWNRNNVFDANETYAIGTINNSTGIDAIEATSNIAVPATASGSTRMRVAFKYSQQATACNSSGWGQAEDYTIQVSSPAPDNASVVSVSPQNVCAGMHDVKARIKNAGNNLINSVFVNWSVDGVSQSSLFWTSPLDTVGGAQPSDTLVTLGSLSFSTGITRDIKVWTSLPNNMPDTVNNDDTAAVSVAARLNCASLPAACVPAFSSYSACVGGALTNVTFAGINNTVPCLTGGGYRDYSDSILAPVIVAGQSYPVSVTVGTASFKGGAAVWIDFDRDGTFSVAEQVFTGTYSASNPTPYTYTGSISIPSGINPGYVRMRVMGRETNTPTAPCGAGYGEAQDYLLYIGSKSANNASVVRVEPASMSFCAGNIPVKARIRNNGINVISYVTINWELDGVVQSPFLWAHPIDTAGSPTGNDTLVDLGTINFVTNVPRTVKVWTSYPNGVSDTTNVDDTVFVTLSSSSCQPPFPLPYCGLSTTLSQVLPISLVTFGTINNSSPAVATTSPEHEDFTAVSTKVVPGETYTMKVKANTDGAWHYMANVFIDWNQNNVFTDPGESYNIGDIYNSTGLDAVEVSASITVPFNAVYGSTRMRVMLNWNAYNTSPCSIASGYGQAEDYTIVVSSRVPNNAGVSELVSPVSYCAGAHDVKVRVANLGNNILNNVTVNWSLDGVPQSSVFWNTPLDTPGSVNGNDTVVMLGNVVFAQGVSHTIEAWTSLPNFVQDTINDDDTLFTITKPSISGTFIIGSAPSDYTSIAAAVNDLNTYGVCGPVELQIKTGTYTGQQIALGRIPGTSPVNTVTISSVGGHQDSVLITNNSTSLNNYLLRLDGTSYVTVKNLSFTALNTTYGNIVELTGNASYDTITSCRLTSQTSSGSSLNSVQLYANAFSGKHIVFTGNRLVNGSYGVYLTGVSTAYADSITISHNSIQNSSYASSYLSYNSNLVYSDNILTPAAAATYGLYCYYTNGSLEISGNRISGQNANYGMQLRYITGSQAVRPLISNNSVAVGNGGSGTSYGIWCREMNYGRIYHNTANVNSSGASSVAGYFYFSSSLYSNNEILNNVWANAAGNHAMYNYLPVYTSCDYNNYYSTGAASLIQASAGSYNSLTAWRSATGQDTRSVSYRPGFTSNSDLTPNTADSAVWSLNGRAIPIPEISSSVNGPGRPALPAAGAPDIGAYEFTPSSLPPAAVATPAVPAAGTSQVFMFAGDTAAIIHWDAFSAVPPVFSLRQHAGERPSIVSPNDYYTNNFISTDMAAGSYYYTIEIPYRESWKGTIVNEHDMRIISYHNNINWMLNATSTVDSAANKLSGQFYQDWKYFTGTDLYNPLPVRWQSFEATLSGYDVLLRWVTASETNNRQFVIERSLDGRLFEEAGSVSGSGTTRVSTAYRFTDAGAFAGSAAPAVLYYRLRQVDRNGAYSFSNTVIVTASRQPRVVTSVFPNPSHGEFNLGVHSPEAAGALIEMYDISGKLVSASEVVLSRGANTIGLQAADLKQGVYFVNVTINGERFVHKLIRQ